MKSFALILLMVNVMLAWGQEILPASADSVPLAADSSTLSTNSNSTELGDSIPATTEPATVNLPLADSSSGIGSTEKLSIGSSDSAAATSDSAKGNEPVAADTIGTDTAKEEQEGEGALDTIKLTTQDSGRADTARATDIHGTAPRVRRPRRCSPTTRARGLATTASIRASCRACSGATARSTSNARVSPTSRPRCSTCSASRSPVT